VAHLKLTFPDEYCNLCQDIEHHVPAIEVEQELIGQRRPLPPS